jgi:pimeloyl-ACP methyl ester carboxylesterase
MPGESFVWATTRVDGLELDHAIAGPAVDCPTLVSLPGSAGIEMSWAKDELARELRVIEVNPPGWGGRPAPRHPMTNAELAAVLAVAITHLIDGPFILLGTSAGGANALHVAAQLADRVCAVVLEGSVAPSLPADHRGPLPQQGDGNLDEIADDMPRPRPHPRKPWATPAFFAERRRHQLALFEWFRPEFVPLEQIGLINDRCTPVLALLGDHDELIKPSQEETIRRLMPHADFRLIKGGAHDLQNSEPEAFVQEVRTLIQRLHERPASEPPAGA